MLRPSSTTVAVLLLFALHPRGNTSAGEPPTAAQLEFFETRIRPVLVEQCYKCHNSAQSAQGGLAVDQRSALLQGGDGGAVIVPGNPGESSLLAILRHEIDGLKMPKGGSRLEATVIEDFARWIEMGAPDPRDTAPTAEELSKTTSWEAVFSKRKEWWSFQPVVKPTVPLVQSATGASHPVDLFLQARQEEQGLTPASPADRLTLLRRVTFTLTGLPPSPEEIQAFLADTSKEAYDRVVNRLVDSPHFGERWARHWMDLVRYCESHGSQGDPELANAWRYRDYLIRAFNTDLPYDQLVREHLAGDLLFEPRWNVAESFNESAIGTAHLRMVELGYIPVDALEDQVKVVDNQIDVVTKTFLGLTVSCARCHDHKFDPISQEDFYALYGIFASCRPGQVIIDSPAVLETNREELTRLKQVIREELAAAWRESAATLGARLQQHSALETQVVSLNSQVRRLREEIAAIEDPVRLRVLRNRGVQTFGSPPVPDSRWSFEGDARDSRGNHHGELLGGAVIRKGRLILDGLEANMRTVPLERDYLEKTLEAWVALANHSQRGGGVIGLDTPEGQFFDSIVFGEINPAHWMAGSDFFRRSQDPEGPEETSPPHELVHVAIVYQKDNSITVYRNGEPYGKSYQKGSLQPFLKGKSRFLFGQRLSNINPPLAGEVEEARAYARALTAEEVASSFRAGAAAVSDEELALALTEAERSQLTPLRLAETQAEARLKQLEPADRDHDPWKRALADAASNNSSPLHLWQQATIGSGESMSQDALRALWTKHVDFWQTELQSRLNFNQAQFVPQWDLRTSDRQVWFGYGIGLSGESSLNGEICIEPDGERIITGILPAGLFTHVLTRKHNGVLTSPRFRIDSNSVSIRALGQNSMARLVIENYPIGNGGIYPATRLARDEMGWLRLDTSYRLGAHAHFEFITDPAERAHFGVAQIVASNQAEPPRELAIPILGILHGEAPSTPEELASRIAECVQNALHAWQTGSCTEEQLALLDFFVRRELLPTTLARLPRLSETVERFRQLEREIPVPRRAPGMLEAEAFDQPLFVRGVHTHPAQTVPRHGLSLIDATPFCTRQSGRLELARQLTAPENPLTARVLVNRLWHHIFGRGLVATVDNFGHMGNPPTHPELLDFLAAKFVEESWSMKSMLRFLVTSQAFQQSSQTSPAAAQSDPANLLLSHMPVRRLEAEAVRDAILATSGQLDRAMYGPGIDVYYVAKTEGGGPKGPLDGDRRRSVYLRIRRNAHNPFLEAFDAPKPAITRGKRDVTNVPLQSLTMLNDPFIIDQAAKWAKVLVADGLEPAERIRRMYLRALCREPTDRELKATLLYLQDLMVEHEAPLAEAARQELVWQDLAQAIFCLKEFVYVH